MMTAEATPPPHLDEAPPSKPSPRVVHVWRVGALVGAVVVSVALLLVALAAKAGFLWPLPFVLLAFSLAIYLPAASWRAWSYRVGEVDVRIRRGVLWRTTSVVLHSRIQHVDTRQGPLERSLGLASVVIFTAGTVGAMVTIPGLPAGEAEMLRDRLAALSGSEDAL